ncbi:hypothetical protein R3P38DRAFT_3068816 [Favolaschia claudopus]|uniref:F-box domain-containing protein n=1 Tax=Favolaschia claudopus TaxID=2862362 RepID=A0AAW0A1V3_9AGAR
MIMHRGLHILEVVELICAAADPSTLAALARTCRALQSPALTVLWETQSELTNLLSCLPSDVWETHPSLPYHHSFSFRRPIVPSDLPRLLFYAARVKNLYVQRPNSISWSIYAALSLALPEYPLLPNLRHLSWRPTEDACSHIRMLVGQKLRSIILDLDGTELVRRQILPYLAAFHPDLTDIHIYPMFSNSSATLESVYSTIRSMKYLRDLYVATVDSSTLLHLAQLPHLSHLRLNVFPQLHDDFFIRIATIGPVFCALRQLTTYSESIVSFCRLIEMIDADVLTELELGFNSTVKPQDWQALSTTIAQRFSKTINQLDIQERCSPEDEIPDRVDLMIPKEAFQPLLACGHLEGVDIQTLHGILIDNDFVKKVAEAWPRLRNLALAPMAQPAQYKPSVTLAGLVPLAEHCRYLERLIIIVDATGLDPHAREKPGGGISSESLLELYVVESPISSPAAVASFLSAIFPELCAVASREKEERNMLVQNWEEDMEKWERVRDLVHIFASARAQEHYVPRSPPP